MLYDVEMVDDDDDDDVEMLAQSARLWVWLKQIDCLPHVVFSV